MKTLSPKRGEQPCVRIGNQLTPILSGKAGKFNGSVFQPRFHAPVLRWREQNRSRQLQRRAGAMSGYRGGYFVCPFYSRDYKDYLNCEGGQIKMPKEALDDYMARYCANSTAWRSCTIARALLLNYERKERHDKQAKDRRA